MSLPPTWTLFGEDHLPHRVLLLAKMLDRDTSRHLQESFDLTLAEWRVLAFVGSAGPASAADVGTAFEVDRAEVSRAVARLVQAGLIRRQADTSNRKRLILVMTDRGKTVFEQARLQRLAYFRSVMQDLDQTERQILASTLDKLGKRVGTISA